MKWRSRTILCCTLLLAVSTGVGDEQPAPVPNSVNDMMISKITPATNTLWGIEDPQTDDEWQIFIDAANVVIDAANAIKQGGAGPNDDEWAQDPEWQAFADVIISAGIEAREAARNKDLDAMFNAGEVLYPPCEECHIQFHPGFQ